MKKLYAALIIILVGIFMLMLYIRANAPLYIWGWGKTYYPDKEEVKGIVLDIKNKGFTGLNLENVFINENENPEVVELGISRTSSLVQMSAKNEIEEQGISFHKLGEVEVKVDLTPEQRLELSNDKNVIKHYGVWIQTSGEPVYKITIRYRYLGIPFMLHKSLKG